MAGDIPSSIVLRICLLNGEAFVISNDASRSMGRDWDVVREATTTKIIDKCQIHSKLHV